MKKKNYAIETNEDFVHELKKGKNSFDHLRDFAEFLSDQDFVRVTFYGEGKKMLAVERGTATIFVPRFESDYVLADDETVEAVYDCLLGMLDKEIAVQVEDEWGITYLGED